MTHDVKFHDYNRSSSHISNIRERDPLPNGVPPVRLNYVLLIYSNTNLVFLFHLCTDTLIYAPFNEQVFFSFCYSYSLIEYEFDRENQVVECIGLNLCEEKETNEKEKKNNHNNNNNNHTVDWTDT